jgi:hypothetical protein
VVFEAQLEVAVLRRCVSGAAEVRDRLPPSDGVALGDENFSACA